MEAYINKYIVQHEFDLGTGKPVPETYINCCRQVKIYRYSDDELVVYIPSLNLGKSYFKQLKGIAYDYQDSDIEVEFKFHENDLDKVAQVVKAKLKRVKNN